MVLILLLSFAASVYGLRPMSINATECSVANGAAVAANICCLRPKQHEPRAQRASLPMNKRCVRYMHTSRLLLLSKRSKKSAQRGMSRTGLRLATATPALAALRPAHEHTRAEHARHARTTRARLASNAHALTRQHALTSKSLAAVLESLATGCPSAGSPLAHVARIRFANTLAISAAREAHASTTHCACHPPPTLSPYAET